MNVLAHHEALLVVQASAGLTLSGGALVLLAQWAKIRRHMVRLRTSGPHQPTGSVHGRTQQPRRVGAEPHQRGQ